MNSLRGLIIFAALVVATIQARATTRPDDSKKTVQMSEDLLNAHVKYMGGKLDTNLEINKTIQESGGHQTEIEDIFTASEKGDLAGVKYWYGKDPSSINTKNEKKSNFTPLIYASRNGHLAVVEFLLSKGVDIEAGSAFHNATPLMYASLKGFVPIVKALLDKGANVNHQETLKYTPLHWAILEDHLPVVKVLIERGANQSLKNIENQTPLDLARAQRLKPIVDYLSSL